MLVIRERLYAHPVYQDFTVKNRILYRRSDIYINRPYCVKILVSALRHIDWQPLLYTNCCFSSQEGIAITRSSDKKWHRRRQARP